MAKKAAKKDTVKVARDSRDGKFVSKDQLKRRPATTIQQTVKKPRPKKG